MLIKAAASTAAAAAATAEAVYTVSVHGINRRAE